MKKIFIGLIIGIFLCVSAFEVIHRSVEITGFKLCSVIYDTLTKQYRPDFVSGLRIMYKFFAFPVKTIWIQLSDDAIAVANGRGEMHCDGDWKFKRYGE